MPVSKKGSDRLKSRRSLRISDRKKKLSAMKRKVHTSRAYKKFVTNPYSNYRAKDTVSATKRKIIPTRRRSNSKSPYGGMVPVGYKNLSFNDKLYRLTTNKGMINSKLEFNQNMIDDAHSLAQSLISSIPDLKKQSQEIWENSKQWKTISNEFANYIDAYSDSNEPVGTVFGCSSDVNNNRRCLIFAILVMIIIIL